MDQWSFTSPFEGVVPWLYRDTGGNMTAGVGFLFRSLGEAQLLAWDPPSAIALDWAEVSQQPAGQPAGAYRPHTRARLSELEMRREFNRRLAAIQHVLDKTIRLASLPEAAQTALSDMAYNLGGGFLSHWPALLAALRARDWHACAAQCTRRGIGAARNAATVALFDSLC